MTTRLIVNSNQNNGFGFAPVDQVADNIAESIGIIVSPMELSVTFTQGTTINNVNVTVPVTIDMRYNPHGVILTGAGVLAVFTLGWMGYGFG